MGCLSRNKFDVFDMSKWYRTCGLDYEKQNQCASKCVSQIDKECRSELDKVAKKFAKDTNADASAEMEKLSQCVRFCAKKRGVAINEKECEDKFRAFGGAFSVGA